MFCFCHYYVIIITKNPPSPNTFAMVLADATLSGMTNENCSFNPYALNWTIPASGCGNKENKEYNLDGRTWYINGDLIFTNVTAINGTIVFKGAFRGQPLK